MDDAKSLFIAGGHSMTAHNSNQHSYQPQNPNPNQPKPTFKATDQENLLAIGSYASIFFGLPLFIVPLATRDSEFALYHAKQAAVIFCMQILFVFVMVFGMFATMGFGFFLFPLAFLPFIPAVHGMILAANREMREPVLLFGLADNFFGSFTAKK